MEAERKILNLLLGGPRNEIRFLRGLERELVNLLMARSAVRKLGKNLRDARPSLAEAVNLIDSNVYLAANVKNKKFVYYNGSVFTDCFSPKWPGRAFTRAVDTLARSMTERTDDWTPFIPSLVFSITKKCVYRCEHCYAVQTLGGDDVIPLEGLLRIAKDFQKIGVAVMAWEGGEPLLRFDDLLTLIRETRDESDSIIATTAYGLNAEKARRLREAGLDAAIISLDHYEPDKHNEFRRNKKAFDMAVNGVRIFRENGILPSVAICATREIVDEGGLYEYLELAKEIGVAFIQVLDATPSGNYIGKNVMLSKSQIDEIKQFQIRVNSAPRYRDYPSVQARALLEDEENYGCCAGNALVYVDSSGNLQPCDLLQISFGNVLEEGVETVYRRMKEHFPHPTKGRCPAQTLSAEIAKEYKKTESLPLSRENCSHIIEKIETRGLPRQLQAVRDKQRRKTLRDFLSFAGRGGILSKRKT